MATSTETQENERRADSVLLVAFGGPTPGCCKQHDPCPGEAYCFVHEILGKSSAREKRTKEVAAHYRLLGTALGRVAPRRGEQTGVVLRAENAFSNQQAYQ